MKKRLIFQFIAFIVLFLNFSANFWNITSPTIYKTLDTPSEGMAYGRLARSKVDGIFSHGAFLGVNYSIDESNINMDPDNNMDDRFKIFISNTAAQKNIYLEGKPVPEAFFKYRTHPGGQMVIYSTIDKFFPFSPKVNHIFFRIFNAFLTTAVFFIFLIWINKKFGIVPSIVTFLLILFSPWITRYADSLFWTCSGLFIPFIGTLYILEKKLPEIKSLAFIFLFFFIKCLFTGYEFITCVYFSVFIPIIFYSYLEKQSLKKFIVFSAKAGIICGLAVLLTCGISMLQHYMAYGSFEYGMQFIINSYERRTGYNETLYINDTAVNPLVYILVCFSKGNIANFSFLDANIKIPFAALFGIIYLSVAGIYFLIRNSANNRLYKALILSTSLSIFPPLTWLLVFKEHAIIHPHLDYICWYIPLALMGYVSIGVFFVLLYKKKF